MANWWDAAPVVQQPNDQWWSGAQIVGEHPPAGNGGLVAGTLDFLKSIPRGMVGGLTSLPNPSAVPMQDYEMEMAPMRAGARQTLQDSIHQPQGRAGQYGEAIGEGLGNPISYIGPGGLALKLGGAVLSSAGSEAAGQATEGTPYEGPARLAGAVAGAAGAARTLGPGKPKAKVPTREELKAAADQGYNAARSSGLELDPTGLAAFAAKNQQELTAGPKYAFTGGQNGTARNTLALLDELQNPPAGAIQTAANLDTLRRRIGDIAGETKEFKPTSDAKAAMVLKRSFEDYLENLPRGAVVAGDADAFARALRGANADYAAASRVGNIEQRLDNARVNYEGQIAGNLANQVKSQLRPILKNPKAQRGFTQDEIAAIDSVNKGTGTSNILSQLGRAGAGVIPLGTQAVVAIPAAVATGGASVVPQAILAAALYGARKGGEHMTVKAGNKLAETLAKRSPLYESRKAALPQHDQAPQMAALIRALLTQQQ